MITVRTMWQTGVIVSLTLFVTGQARSQFPWQTPVKRDPAEIARIVGPSVRLDSGPQLFHIQRSVLSNHFAASHGVDHARVI